MLNRAICVLIFPLMISACTTQAPSRDQVWETIEGCGGDERCAFATLAADEYNKLAGKPLGNGISVRGAQTDGTVLSLDVNVPERIKTEPTRDGRTAEQELAYSMRKDLCGDRNTRRFFEIGGKLVLSTYLPSGERFSRSQLESC